MFSKFIRIVYSLSYFSLMLVVLEFVNIVNSWKNIEFYWNFNIEGFEAFCVIHYPIMLFLLMLLSCKYIIEKAINSLSVFSMKIEKSNPIGLNSFMLLGQLVPLLSLSDKILNFSYSGIIFVIIVLLLWAFFTSYGAFNMSLYFMQYNQYKVSTNSSEYWLISKRKIRDISRSYHVVEISNKVFLIV